jgi:hypothetical protein
MGSLKLPENMPDGIYTGFIAPDKVGLVLSDIESNAVASATKTLNTNGSHSYEQRRTDMADAMVELSLIIADQADMRYDLHRALGIDIGVYRIEINEANTNGKGP